MDEKKRIELLANIIIINAYRIAKILVKYKDLVLKLKKNDELALYSNDMKKHELAAS